MNLTARTPISQATVSNNVYHGRRQSEGARVYSRRAGPLDRSPLNIWLIDVSSGSLTSWNRDFYGLAGLIMKNPSGSFRQPGSTRSSSPSEPGRRRQYRGGRTEDLPVLLVPARSFGSGIRTTDQGGVPVAVVRPFCEKAPAHHRTREDGRTHDAEKQELAWAADDPVRNTTGPRGPG